jgi:hypothetical protein
MIGSEKVTIDPGGCAMMLQNQRPVPASRMASGRLGRGSGWAAMQISRDARC